MGRVPSQRPVALCLFFSAVSTSIFFSIRSPTLSSFQFDCPMLVMSCHVLLRYCLLYYYCFLYLFMVEYWSTVEGELHTRHSYQQQPECNYYNHYYRSSIDVILPAPLLTPLLFLHPFHAAGFAGQAKLSDTKTSRLSEAPSSEWSLLAPCPAAVSGDGYWPDPKPHVQSRHMRMPFESGVTSG